MITFQKRYHSYAHMYGKREDKSIHLKKLLKVRLGENNIRIVTHNLKIFNVKLHLEAYFIFV
ncbi:MAG: hypothetical protein CM15mP23_08290 [Cryomorphaceae bacterium]|nr:MAG: hypothetical protein CM15mP23_08290 [Cryomorphaceae bacterium]